MVSGSSTDLRDIQFSIAAFYLSKSFLIGNGIGYTFDTALAHYPELQGAESIWLPVIIDRGIIGVISYIVLMIYTISYCFRREEKWLLFFVLGFWSFFSLSSIPNYDLLMPVIAIIFMVEAKNIYGNKKGCINKNSKE